MKRGWWILAAFAAVFALGWVSSSLVAERRGKSHGNGQIQRDTITIVDTQFVDKPVPYLVRVVDTLLVPVPVPSDNPQQADTLYAPLPVEVREYGDSSYRAQVSGIHPSLDWIEVYPRTTTITEREQVPVPVVKRWGFGVQAGFGVQYGIIGKRADFGPYFGFGVEYHF